MIWENLLISKMMISSFSLAHITSKSGTLLKKESINIPLQSQKLYSLRFVFNMRNMWKMLLRYYLGRVSQSESPMRTSSFLQNDNVLFWFGARRGCFIGWNNLWRYDPRGWAPSCNSGKYNKVKESKAN